eukprot:TRINITY_DN4812_c0_g1_i1.p1 TRINITY_DN4812_c0_g1~~TRINITY_DN4812_c0_g1_i1.p1  ORF type:complete len:181 (-),score=12.35 TRINITY_DN4812_c0_g1_i1:201-743(-)
MAAPYNTLPSGPEPAVGYPYQAPTAYPTVLPAPQPPQLTVGPGKWTHGLCGCIPDLLTCQHVQLHIETCFCPCVTFGRIAEMVDEGRTPCPNGAAIWYILEQFTLLGCIYSCWYRQKLRNKYNIPAGPFTDAFVHLCCPICAFCQEFKELESRGMNPGLGYPLGAYLNPLEAPQPAHMTA